jgi:hypothetical protein
MSEAGETRVVPLHCPYCGGEALRPDEQAGDAWRCGGCRRVFSVKFLGLWSGIGVTA